MEGAQQGVTGAGMLVSTAHRDFTDSFGEAYRREATRRASRGRESARPRALRDPRNRLRRVLVAEGGRAGNHERPERRGAALREKAPDELEAYRHLVLDVATAVAEAKGGMQDEEKAAIDSITAALGTP